MNLNLSNRIQNIEESSTLAMSSKARELKSKGVDVISLSLGEPDFKTPSHICEGAKKAIDSGNYFSYPPVNGYLDLREAIYKLGELTGEEVTESLLDRIFSRFCIGK